MKTLLVPTEPTSAMVSAMVQCLSDARADRRLHPSVLRDVYRAALSARVGELYPMPESLTFTKDEGQ